MDIADFLAQATSTFDPHSGLRYGQHWFNTLYAVRPDIADKIRATKLDPFHKDNVSHETLDFVITNWHG